MLESELRLVQKLQAKKSVGLVKGIVYDPESNSTESFDDIGAKRVVPEVEVYITNRFPETEALFSKLSGKPPRTGRVAAIKLKGEWIIAGPVIENS